jgi:hypothetical protein
MNALIDRIRTRSKLLLLAQQIAESTLDQETLLLETNVLMNLFELCNDNEEEEKLRYYFKCLNKEHLIVWW